MDLFKESLRTRQDVLQDTVFYPDDGKADETLQKAHEVEVSLFDKFLQTHYMKFQIKINRCKLNCINKATNYKQISTCEMECETGVHKFQKFIDTQIQDMQMLLNNCVFNAETLPNSMNEIYRCHDLYTKGFKALKAHIIEESLYYE